MKFSILACIKGKVSSSTVHQAKQKPRKHSEDTKGDSQSEKRKSTSSKHSRTPSASSEKSSKTSKEKSKDSKKEMRPTSSSPSPPPSTRSSKVSKDPKGKKLKPKRTYKYLSEIQSDNTGKQAEEAGPELVLISEINRGAFGTVWKAKYNGHTVAIEIPTDGTGNLMFITSQFIAEAEVMQLMRHERIVEFIDLEIDTFSIIMELLPYGTLNQYIRRLKQRLDWSIRYQMIADICEGMEFLHSSMYEGKKKKELFHQDLKSSNILLYKVDGVLRAKIGDFGLSLVRDLTESAKKNSKVTHHGGTKYYLAPELWQKFPKFSKKCDVFACGVIMLELITLKKPKGLTEDEWPSIMGTDIAGALKLFLSATLDNDPKLRKTFTELRALWKDHEDEILAIPLIEEL